MEESNYDTLFDILLTTRTRTRTILFISQVFLIRNYINVEVTLIVVIRFEYGDQVNPFGFLVGPHIASDVTIRCKN